MPRLDLTLPSDILSDETKQQLARDLCAILLRAEGAPDTEFFRSITWAHIHELPAEAIQTPDGVAEPHVVVDVTVPAGALSERRKGVLVQEATKRVLEATGWGPEAGVRVWTLIHEVPEGSWGAAGQIVHFEQLRAAAKAEREKEGTGKAEVPAAAGQDKVPA